MPNGIRSDLSKISVLPCEQLFIHGEYAQSCIKNLICRSNCLTSSASWSGPTKVASENWTQHQRTKHMGRKYTGTSLFHPLYPKFYISIQAEIRSGPVHCSITVTLPSNSCCSLAHFIRLQHQHTVTSGWNPAPNMERGQKLEVGGRKLPIAVNI